MEQFRELRAELKEMSVQCDELEYKTDEPLETEETKVKAAACQPTASKPTVPTMLCRQHKRAECPQCIYISTPTHHCQALIAICQECGLHYLIIADACQLQNKVQQMPVADGTVKGKPVSVLRDTGCSTVVVRRSLVSDEKLTGQECCFYWFLSTFYSFLSDFKQLRLVFTRKQKVLNVKHVVEA